jgi:hypothetical protein
MLNFIKVVSVITKFKLNNVKPTIHRTVKTHPKMEQGWFIRVGNGGISGEALMRVNMGKSYSSFPIYNRKGVQRTNSYVPIKGDRVQVLR